MFPAHPTAQIDGHTHHLFTPGNPATLPVTLCGKRIDGVAIERGPVTCRECRDAREIPDGAGDIVVTSEQFDELLAALERPPKPNRKMVDLLRRTRGTVRQVWE